MIIKTYQESGNLSPSRGLARDDNWPSSTLKMCHPSISEKLPQILSFARNFKFMKQKKRKSDSLKTEWVKLKRYSKIQAQSTICSLEEGKKNTRYQV